MGTSSNLLGYSEYPHERGERATAWGTTGLVEEAAASSGD
jgi:hypothetical protein